ncbi:MAG: permease [Candidatus Firestonebacteria bacterium RIFOXYC2_FULL_39_67]|nr:MAG: permease [Candidatus Firestonebacteria bacterium RIFOXYD2_FULL_39_29]OGF53950.1 MAG: permease [Candidatus Firestonebacteria bacterium RifOxyC12_full_39_7]OGF54190.1 MAG: permease [Candidatus Firestonebacteria bacterium RIFOXYC2_FULL_39_67]
MKETFKFLGILLVFLCFYFIPFESLGLSGAFLEAFMMAQDYARQHVLLCLVPAFFIAGAITNFVKQESVIKYLGAGAKKVTAYGVASVSGAILAVCSCTVLPLFAGIYTNGAGLGPAATFLYSGPAINVLAVILSARVLGIEIGIARAVGAVGLSIIIGLLMHFFFLKEDRERQAKHAEMFAANADVKERRNLLQTSIFFGILVLILIFANWSKAGPGCCPPDLSLQKLLSGDLGISYFMGFWGLMFKYKWIITIALLTSLGIMLVNWFEKDEMKTWVSSTWDFTKQILPLLLGGVLAAGFLLGRPGHEGLIPSAWIAKILGGNGIGANLFASVAGALMYFATLTEVPILQGLIGSGMGKGPALTLLLAGPSLSLPSMIVIVKMIGVKKGLTYIGLIIILSAIAGMIFGAM